MVLTKKWAHFDETITILDRHLVEITNCRTKLPPNKPNARTLNERMRLIPNTLTEDDFSYIYPYKHTHGSRKCFIFFSIPLIIDTHFIRWLAAKYHYLLVFITNRWNIYRYTFSKIMTFFPLQFTVNSKLFISSNHSRIALFKSFL